MNIPSTPISRRSLLSLAGACAGATALGGTSACGNDDGSDNPEIWVLQDPVQNKVQQAAVDRFNQTNTASNSADITLNPYQSTSYTDKLRVSMGSTNQPDIFFNWGGGSIRSYVQSDLLVDLTDTLAQDPTFKAKFLPAVLDAGTLDGKYYGIPLRGMQPVILYYHKEIFAQVGATPPTTWQETLSLVDTFKGAGITPFALAGSQGWPELMWLECLTDRFGGPDVFNTIASGDKNAWGHTAITQALDTIIDLVDRGGFGTNFSSVNYDSAGASTVFATGKAAMHLMGTWEYTNQLDQQPDFAKNNLTWTSFPTVEGGAGDPRAIVGNPTNYFSITKQSKYVDECIAFLKQEMASDDYVNDWIVNGDVPPVADIADRMQNSANPEFASYVYNMVNQAPTFQLSWDQAIDSKYSEPMLTNLQKIFLGELDSKGYVSAMEALQ